jgi:hypothetical protein
MASFPYSSMPSGIDSGVKIAAPTPCMILQKISRGSVGASPQQIEETPNKNKPIKNSFFLPKISAILEKLMSNAENAIRYAVLTHEIPVVVVPKYFAILGSDTFTIVLSKTVRKQAISIAINARLFFEIFIVTSFLCLLT